MSEEFRARQQRAEFRFAKAQTAAREGAKAKLQYETDAAAVRKKTERLRALRLAKEAAEANAKS